MNIAVIGSGLAAAATARALVVRGVKPVVMDVGLEMEEVLSQRIRQLSTSQPTEWDFEIKSKVFANPTILGDGYPKKLAFGSDFFYGRSVPGAEVSHEGIIPPFSYAKGGLSVGWGASVLPPDGADISDWPISSDSLAPYFQQALEGLPYSACDDGLSARFPLYSTRPDSLRVSSAHSTLLKRLSRANLNPDVVLFGQARLLTRSRRNEAGAGCQYCGRCLNGCVYDCIYKASHTIDNLAAAGKIEYRKGIRVDSIREAGNKVIVNCTSLSNELMVHSFDRIFIGAGAVNSTRIILSSLKRYDEQVILRSTSGFVMPFLTLTSLKGHWPISNTQPGIFIEFKIPELSNNWIHVQMSTPNELVYERLKIPDQPAGLSHFVKRKIVDHMVVATCNLHSCHGNGFVLKLKRSSDRDVLTSTVQDLPKVLPAQLLAKRGIVAIAKKIGCFGLKSQAIHAARGGGYHVGGSMPMSSIPDAPLATDLLGRPKAFERVHVIDSSVLPSLPGTTIGLVSMANAMRIATEVDLL